MLVIINQEDSGGYIQQNSIQKPYIGIESKLFHKKDCKLNTGKTKITIVEAKKKGYKPCTVCFPPKKNTEEKKTKK